MRPCSVRSLLEYSGFSFSHLSAKGITGIYFRSRDIKTSFFPTSWVPTTQVNVIPVLKRPFIPSRSDEGLHSPGLWQADLLSLVTPLLGRPPSIQPVAGLHQRTNDRGWRALGCSVFPSFSALCLYLLFPMAHERSFYYGTPMGYFWNHIRDWLEPLKVWGRLHTISLLMFSLQIYIWRPWKSCRKMAWQACRCLSWWYPMSTGCWWAAGPSVAVLLTWTTSSFQRSANIARWIASCKFSASGLVPLSKLPNYSVPQFPHL